MLDIFVSCFVSMLLSSQHYVAPLYKTEKHHPEACAELEDDLVTMPSSGDV